MRRQDELLALYPIVDPPTRQYLVGLLSEMPIHFDADEMEGLLTGARLDAHDRVAAQALVTWHRIGPQLLLYEHGLDDEHFGEWSQWLTSTAKDALAQAELLRRPDALVQRTALAPLIAPCHARLLEVAGAVGPVGDIAREILGLIPVPGGTDVLAAGAADPGRALTSLLALAQHDPARTAELIGRETAVPLAVRSLAASSVGGEACAKTLWESIRSGDELSRWGAAAALPHLFVPMALDMARALLDTGEGWVQVVTLDALGRVASSAPAEDRTTGPLLAALVDRSLRSATHDLVRIAAVRAMGGVSADIAVKQAMRCLKRGSPHLQAAAIETLVRLDHREPGFCAMLSERARAAPLKLRSVAILGLMTVEPDAALMAALELSNDANPTARVAGTHCLGYIQSKTSLDVLALLAEQDTFLPAAIQAQKGLSHYPEATAAPILLRLLDHADPAIALGAVRVLTHFRGEVTTPLGAALEKLERRLDGTHARVLLRNAGRLGPAHAGIADFLTRPRALGEAALGALEGLARAALIPGDLARRASGSPDPLVGVQGCLAAVLAGDLSAIDSLARWLERPEGLLPGLLSLRDLAVVTGRAGWSGRHAPLRGLLASVMPGQQGEEPQPCTPTPPRYARSPVHVLRSEERVLERLGTGPDNLLADLSVRVRARPGETAPADRPHWALELTLIQSQGLALLARARALAHPALLGLVALAALGLIGVSVAHRPASGPARLVDPVRLDPALAVSATIGTPRLAVGSHDEPLAVGRGWRERETLRLGAGDAVSLESRAQLRVVAMSASEVELVRAPRAGADAREIVLDLRRGVVVVDGRAGRPATSTTIRAPEGVVTGRGGVLRAQVAAGALTVHVGTGTASLASRDGSGEVELAAGQSASVRAGAHPGAPQPFKITAVEWP